MNHTKHFAGNAAVCFLLFTWIKDLTLIFLY